MCILIILTNICKNIDFSTTFVNFYAKRLKKVYFLQFLREAIEKGPFYEFFTR